MVQAKLSSCRVENSVQLKSPGVFESYRGMKRVSNAPAFVSKGSMQIENAINLGSYSTMTSQRISTPIHPSKFNRFSAFAPTRSLPVAKDYLTSMSKLLSQPKSIEAATEARRLERMSKMSVIAISTSEAKSTQSQSLQHLVKNPQFETDQASEIRKMKKLKEGGNFDRYEELMNLKYSEISDTDNYRVITDLGFGGQGSVYLAEDTRSDQKVVLKIFYKELLNAPNRRLNL
mmetsp:Transcript_3426/g.5809  ORF Transcript_3426/g.5809 Transcript_3426/m.5809 type:complete len:232 (+) Transcript_3426:119-814(+)